MSYAGVESEDEYYERQRREREISHARYIRESDPVYIAEKAKKVHEEKITRARAQLEFHLEKVKELRKMILLLERS